MITNDIISYEIILKYLAPPVNNFSNQPNIILQSSNFKYFKNIFDDTFYRFGIEAMNKMINVSFINSISYCLDQVLPNLDDLEQDIWALSNSLHINIIVFDFTDGNIYSAYFGDFFNPWRPTIFLANDNNWWEPIVSKDTKIFSNSSTKSQSSCNSQLTIFKNKILLQEIFKYKEVNTKITLNDNFMDILEIEQLTGCNDTFINKNVFSKNKLDKMKKDELIQILINMTPNMILSSKITKKECIKLICKE